MGGFWQGIVDQPRKPAARDGKGGNFHEGGPCFLSAPALTGGLCFRPGAPLRRRFSSFVYVDRGGFLNPGACRVRGGRVWSRWISRPARRCGTGLTITRRWRCEFRGDE